MPVYEVNSNGCGWRLLKCICALLVGQSGFSYWAKMGNQVVTNRLVANSLVSRTVAGRVKSHSSPTADGNRESSSQREQKQKQEQKQQARYQIRLLPCVIKRNARLLIKVYGPCFVISIHSCMRLVCMADHMRETKKKW